MKILDFENKFYTSNWSHDWPTFTRGDIIVILHKFSGKYDGYKKYYAYNLTKNVFFEVLEFYLKEL